VHLRADGQGHLVSLSFTPGQQHESTVVTALLDQGAVRRPGPGRPRLRPARLVGDKGYSSGWLRQQLRQRRIRVTIPRKSNQRRCGPFDREQYRQRNRIERLINRFKQFRRIATRYEKCAENYRAMWLIAATLLYLNFANTP
jgi:transposase